MGFNLDDQLNGMFNMPPAVRPATQKQLGMIWGLMKELGREPLWMDVLNSIEARDAIKALLREKASRGL
jgi:hypothetical protein